jgi:tetratricopeptide (TPR) repeat protein
MVRMLAGTRGGHRYEAAGELILKGIPDPVAACTVQVDAPTETRTLPPALAQAPTEVVVGREQELEVLVGAAKEAGIGHRRAVLLAGEPGVGKTRLAAALARRAHDDGATVLFGRCEEDLAVPFQPFIEPLQTIWRDLPPEERRGHIAAHGGELARLVPSLDGPEPMRADPGLEQARLFDAVDDALRRASAARPLVLVLDDLHWAAPATVALVRHLLGASADLRLLVVGTYRDTEVDRGHALGGLLSDVHRIDGVERLSLRGLDRGAVEDLFTRMSGDELDAGGRALAAAVEERTAGNPFFVNQVLRHLVERGALVQDGGRWVVHGELADLDLPEGVLDVVGRRLSGLSPAANQALTVAALCGLSFGVRVLRAVPDAGDPDAVVDGLDEAVRARLLVETGPGQLTFAHAIVRDALLRELTTAKAARLHRAIGEAMLTVYGSAPPLAELAHHFTEAAILGDTATAARWATAAAAAASAQADHRGGVEVLERALAVIEAVEPVDQQARFEVAAAASEVLYLLAEVDEHLTAAAVDAARQLGDGMRLLRVASGRYPGGTGILDATRLALFDEALELLPDDASPLRCLAVTGQIVHRALQANNRFIDDLEPFLAELPGLTAEAPQLSRLVHALNNFAMLGLPGAARRLELAERGLAIPTDAPDPWLERLGLHLDMSLYQEGYRGHALLAMGDRAGFEADAHHALDGATRAGHMSVVGMTEAQLGCLALVDGRFDEVRERLAAMMAASATDVNFLLSYFAVNDQLMREVGRLEDAAAAIGPALEVSPDLAAVKAGVARAYYEVGRVDEAIVLVEELIDGWSSWGRDWSWPAVVWQVAEVVAGTRERAWAEVVLRELDLYSGELLLVGAAIYTAGAADRYRGMLLDVLDRHDDAVAALEAGLEHERAIDGPLLTSRSQLWLARALLHRDGAGDRHAAREHLAESIATAERLGQAAVLAEARDLLAELA